VFPLDLRHFTAKEFKFPDAMDVSFLRWLDRVREEAGVPMVITDDFRPANVMPEGASTTSLHFRGRAVDVRSRDWNDIQKWDIAAAIFALAEEAPGKVEFELVHGPTDQHWHIGVNERAINHHLIESDE
jgi:Peptidase M15